MTAGYPGSSKARKIGLKDGLSVQVLGRPDGWDFDVSPQPRRPRFSRDLDALGSPQPRRPRFSRNLDALGSTVFPNGMIWILWPRMAGGHISDMDETIIRDAPLDRGLVDVKVAAIDNDWSGLKPVWRKEHRTATAPPGQ